MTQPRIYTKLGDDGSTGLLFGGRIPKADPLVRTTGSIDEAVTVLGLARAHCTDEAMRALILQVQRDLFVVAADLMANPHARDRLTAEVSRVTPEMVARLEDRIDEFVAKYPLRPVFVVPGANVLSATLDVARSVVRRAEQNLAAARAAMPDDRPFNPETAIYLNRLSDLMYVLARGAAGDDDEPVSHGAPAGAA